MTDGLRIRDAVRALVTDSRQRVLLVRFEFPTRTVWALPGGGVDPGESAHDALRRELAEELGLHDPVIGAHIWNRLHVIPFLNGQFDGQRDEIFEVRVAAGFEPRPVFSWEQLNAEHVFELRWWTLSELETAAPATAPSALASLLVDYFVNGAPPRPIDVDP